MVLLRRQPQRRQAGLTDARVNNNYGGFINCISILYESPSQAPETEPDKEHLLLLSRLDLKLPDTGGDAMLCA